MDGSFQNYNIQENKLTSLINTDDFFGQNLKVDTINNIYFVTRGDEFIKYNMDGSNPKNITPKYSFSINSYVLSPFEKAIYYISENELLRLSYEGQRDTIIKKVVNITLNELCIDNISKKLYYNKANDFGRALIQCEYNGSNQKIIYQYKDDPDLYRMQLDAKNKRMFYSYWDNGSKIGALNLENKTFKELIAIPYGSIFEYCYDDKNDLLYYVNTREKNIEVKDLKTGNVTIVKNSYSAEVSNLILYRNQLIWKEFRGNENTEYYIGNLNDTDQKELFYKDKTVPIRFEYNHTTNRIVRRTNWNQVVSTNINGGDFHLHTDRGISFLLDMIYYKGRLYYFYNNDHIIASSNIDGSDYKIIHDILGLDVTSAVIDSRNDYIYIANRWNQAIERIKTDGSGYEVFWLNKDRDPMLDDIALDKNHNKLIVTEKDCKCIYTLDLDTKEKTILKTGTITTFYPADIVYDSDKDWIYINDEWNNKIFRMKSDGTSFSTLKSNVGGYFIRHYDEENKKMYGVYGDKAEFYEFDENANKVLTLATNFGKKIYNTFTLIPGEEIFFFNDADDRDTKVIFSIDKNTKTLKLVLDSYASPFADYNRSAIDEKNNIYYEYADYSGCLIETNLNTDQVKYYNDWPTFMQGFAHIEGTREFISFTDFELLKFNAEGQIIDTLDKKPHTSFNLRHYYAVTYNKKDKRIYYLDYYTKQIISVNTDGEEKKIHYNFPGFTFTPRRIEFDANGKMYFVTHNIDKQFISQIDSSQKLINIDIPSMKLLGNMILLDSLPQYDSDGDGLAFGIDCNDEVALMSEIPNNGIDEDCDGHDLIIDSDGDGVNDEIDCDDANASINQASYEIAYNTINDDCNDITPDDDIDGDGFLLAEDCNDNNQNINPAINEIPYNNIDDDCDSLTIDNDLDGDGYNYPNDCNDNNALINPGQQEIPYNGLNDDCKFNTPDDDLDGDGYKLIKDCNDTIAAINPGVVEIPLNGIDDNCNGKIDETTSSYDHNHDNIEIYPNPAEDIIYIEANFSISHVEIYSLIGECVLKNVNTKDIDVSDLIPGLYLLKIYNSYKREFVKKIIVK